MYSVGLIVSLVLFVICSFHIQDSASINCYVCSSRDDKNCEYLMRNDTDSHHFVKCNDFTETGDPPFCRKIVQYIKDYDIYRIIRKCGYKRHYKECYTVRNADHEETVCQCFEDACNSAPNISSTLLAVITTLICGVIYKSHF